jgi:predicted phage terminase large subunit-like protein
MSALQDRVEIETGAKWRALYPAADAAPRWQPRAEQRPPPGDWRVWLFMGGRGVGKTRTGAEWTIASARDYPLVNIIGATADDARDVMIEGESGILASAPPDFRPRYSRSLSRLDWPNGAKTLVFTADKPERLRGKQHMRLWADELAAWRYPDAWDQAMFGLRLGADPRAVATTTPRPVRAVRELLAQEASGRVVITRGSTYANRANLAPAFFEQIITKYEGTRLGRQELGGEYLDDTPGALWQRAMFDQRRPAPDTRRVVVAIDPAVTATEESDETGIVVAGLGVDGRGYVLADRSCRLSPDGWARRAIQAYEDCRADRIIYEANQGGDLVAHTLRTVAPRIPLRAIHASRGKRVRAEPVAALYEQGKVTHVEPFDDLEDQLCGWTPEDGDSPDRLDALVYALTELLVDAEPSRKLRSFAGG